MKRVYITLTVVFAVLSAAITAKILYSYSTTAITESSLTELRISEDNFCIAIPKKNSEFLAKLDDFFVNRIKLNDRASRTPILSIKHNGTYILIFSDWQHAEIGDTQYQYDFTFVNNFLKTLQDSLSSVFRIVERK